MKRQKGRKKMNTFTLNHEKNGIEIIFESKPSITIRGALKEHGFRWHRKNKFWYAKQTAERIEFAQSIIKGEDVQPSDEIVGGEFSNGYMGATRWDGYKSKKSLYGSDLSKAIRNDLKAHGVKGCSVRCRSYSGGQSITVTVKCGEADFIPYDEWKETQSILDLHSFGWLQDGNGGQVHTDRLNELTEEEKEDLFNINSRIVYDNEKESSSWQYIDRFTTPTYDFRKKIILINSIINTYRYNDSNGQADYFDTNFYYDIVTKYC